MYPGLAAFIANLIGRVYQDASNLIVPFAVHESDPIYFLGLCYDTHGTDDATSRFLDDFQSRVFLPYRRDFQPIVVPGVYDSASLTTDNGWGCAIRSAQMLVAQSISSIRLGRGFRLSSATHSEADVLRDIVWRFADTPDGELSIHRVVRYGAEKLGKVPGTWFGPSSAAAAVATLWPPSDRIGCIHIADGFTVTQEIFNTLDAHPDGLIMLISLKLGMHTIQLSEYKEDLLRLFMNPLFQGIVGGDDTRAFYIPAVSEGFLYYHDPHVVYPGITSADNVKERMALMPAPFKMGWERLNPQMSLSFVISSRAEAQYLFAFMRSSKLFEVVDTRPTQPIWAGDSSDDDDCQTI